MWIRYSYYIASDMLYYIFLHIFIYANNNETGMYYAYNFNLFVFRFGVDQLMYSINLSILLLHSCMSLIRIFIFEYYLFYFAMPPVTVTIITCNLVSMISIKLHLWIQLTIYLQYCIVHTYNIVCSSIYISIHSCMPIHLFD